MASSLEVVQAGEVEEAQGGRLTRSVVALRADVVALGAQRVGGFAGRRMLGLHEREDQMAERPFERVQPPAGEVGIEVHRRLSVVSGDSTRGRPVAGRKRAGGGAEPPIQVWSGGAVAAESLLSAEDADLLRAALAATPHPTPEREGVAA